MAGSNNFVQYDQTQATLEVDATYASDGNRTAGAVNGTQYPAPPFNKAMYQVSTWVTAMALALSNKGYNQLDGSPSESPGLVTPSSAVTALAAILANVLTVADESAVYSSFLSQLSAGFIFSPSSGAFSIVLPNWLGNFTIMGAAGTTVGDPYGVTFPRNFTEIPIVVAVGDAGTVGVSRASVSISGFAIQAASGLNFQYIAIGK